MRFKAQLTFEFVVAAVLFFSVLLYTINYLNASVSGYKNEFYSHDLQSRVMHISDILVHDTTIGLSQGWPVLNYTKLQEFSDSCSSDYENFYPSLLNGLGLGQNKLRLQINESWGFRMTNVSVPVTPPPPALLPGNASCQGAPGYFLDDVAADFNQGTYVNTTTDGENVTLSLASVSLPSVPTSGLVAYWKLDETSGTRSDSVGNNDLTDQNTVTYTTGKQGYAGQFTRANSEYLSISDNADLSTGGASFTFTAWVYMDSKPGAPATIVSKYTTGSAHEYHLRYNGDAGVDRFQFDVSTDGSDDNILNSSDIGSPSMGVWYFIVAWYDNSANTVNIQVNNGTVDTLTGVSGGGYDGGDSFAIGARATPTDYWDGRIDEVGFWKRVLTARERSELYNNGDGITLASQPSIFGDGSDGALTVSGSQVVNTYAYVTDESLPAGGTMINVNDGSGFSAGDEVLVVGMQGTYAGNYEFVKLQSINGNQLTLGSDLVNSYTSGMFDTQNAQATQVVRVPQYTSVTVQSGGEITAPAWDGYVGGIVVFRANGTVVVSGVINASMKGFMGGVSRGNGPEQHDGFITSGGVDGGSGPGIDGGAGGGSGGGAGGSGCSGWRCYGGSGSSGTTGKGGGGAGGGPSGNSNWAYFGNGGDGGEGGGGAGGGNNYNVNTQGGGGGGKSYDGGSNPTPSDMSTLFMGGGASQGAGGGGSTNGIPDWANGGRADGSGGTAIRAVEYGKDGNNGSAGGGIIFISAGSIDASGGIVSVGGDGGRGGDGATYASSGGGGQGGAGASGGSVYIRAGSITGADNINADGGNGGDGGAGGGSSGGSGGSGGVFSGGGELGGGGGGGVGGVENQWSGGGGAGGPAGGAGAIMFGNLTYVSSGNFTSQVFDAGGVVNWTEMRWGQTLPAGTGSSIFGDGSDGALTVSGSRVVNTYAYVTDAGLSAGGATINVNSGSGFSAGDEILIIQMQNSSGGVPGQYEFARISSVSGNDITLTSGTANAYYSGAFNTTSATATQIVRVPQYTSVTVQSGGEITAPAWDGYVGGIVVFRADTINVFNGGWINVSGRGYRGGKTAFGGYGAGNYAQQGESIYGEGVESPSANVSGGGGADTQAYNYGGGGGGGYGTAGETGTGSSGGFEGGHIIGDAELTNLYFGGGGGGARYTDRNRIGGSGGGIILVFGRNMVSVNAVANGTRLAEDFGSGGAGAGGSIYLIAEEMNLGTVVARGGPRSTFTNYVAGSYSGAGGDGRIRLDYITGTGTTNPLGYNGPGPTPGQSGFTTNITMYARSCNDAACLGESWSGPYSAGPVVLGIPENQYFQYRAVLSTTDTSVTPYLEYVNVSYGGEYCVGGQDVVGYWEFEEGSGSTTADGSVYGNDGTLSNSSMWTVERRVGDYALGFDGVSNYVNVSDSGSLDIDGAIAIEAWIKIVDPSRRQFILSKGTGSYGTGAYILEIFSNNLRFWKTNGTAGAGNTNNWDTITSASPVTAGEWRHVAVTWDGTTDTNNTKLYLDGVLDKNSTGLMGGIQNAGYMTMGVDQDGNNYYVSGIIDSMYIYSRVLSADEIMQHYLYGQPQSNQTSFQNVTYSEREVLSCGPSVPTTVPRAESRRYAITENNTMLVVDTWLW